MKITRTATEAQRSAGQPRFTALRSHYGLDSFFCRPGIEGAHEKGGVEGDIGRFRRRHLVPVPSAGSLAQLNELLAAATPWTTGGSPPGADRQPTMHPPGRPPPWVPLHGRPQPCEPSTAARSPTTTLAHYWPSPTSAALIGGDSLIPERFAEIVAAICGLSAETHT